MYIKVIGECYNSPMTAKSYAEVVITHKKQGGRYTGSEFLRQEIKEFIADAINSHKVTGELTEEGWNKISAFFNKDIKELYFKNVINLRKKGTSLNYIKKEEIEV